VKTIGLCLIAKNEAHVIRRCLSSTLPLIDYFLIVDTGSEDGTQRVVKDFLGERNACGAVIKEPWDNFGYNRTFALRELRKVQWIDYALMIDADDQLVFEDGFDPAAFKSEMQHDLYDVQIRHRDTRYFRAQLCRNELPFRYRGVLHEYLEPPNENCRRAVARGFHIETGRVGARNRNPQKYADDAAILEKALLTETDPPLIARYKFYLAQSYRDAGQSERALKAYLERAELGFWKEEIFLSLYNAGRLKEALEYSDVEIIGTYLKAHEHSPRRAESLHALVAYCHRNGKPALGYLIGKQAITIPMPSYGLFIQTSIYDYGMLDEFAVAAYWAGHYRDSLDACLKLLADGKIPADEYPRVQINADFARKKLSVDQQ
jgi:glycosyltransferase involved in cell wall biosynthesis